MQSHQTRVAPNITILIYLYNAVLTCFPTILITVILMKSLSTLEDHFTCTHTNSSWDTGHKFRWRTSMHMKTDNPIWKWNTILATLKEQRAKNSSKFKRGCLPPMRVRNWLTRRQPSDECRASESEMNDTELKACEQDV